MPERKLLASLGHPADEERGSWIVVQYGDTFKEALSGEPLTRDDVVGALAQAERYVKNLREALGLE